MTASVEVRRRYRPKGAALVLFNAREREILVEGPAGTGKTRAILELLNLLAHTYAGLRVLMVRKHAVTLTTTALATFNEEVIDPASGVTFFGGSRDEAASYRYPNGSRIVVGGMGDGKDATAKILSSRYDVIYANEATELGLEEWETLTTRLRQPEKPAQRADGTPFEAQRIIADCNPSFATHWLYKRVESGSTRLITSKLEDNPAYFDDEGKPTAAGQAYLATLDALTGTRYQRLRLGLRVGVENAIYGTFDREVHVRPLEPGLVFRDGAFGADYGRVHKAAVYVVSVDQYGRRWVREGWSQPDTEHGLMTLKNVARLKSFYQVKRGRVDINQDVLIALLGTKGVSLAEGSRQARIDKTARLWSVFPGGRVPYLSAELNRNMEHGPFMEPDSPGLLLVEGAPGIEELASCIEGYHYVHVSTDREEKDVVARIDDDPISAVEDAIEELEEPMASDVIAGAMKQIWGEGKNADPRDPFSQWTKPEPKRSEGSTARAGAEVGGMRR